LGFKFGGKLLKSFTGKGLEGGQRELRKNDKVGVRFQRGEEVGREVFEAEGNGGVGCNEHAITQNRRNGERKRAAGLEDQVGTTCFGMVECLLQKTSVIKKSGL